MDRPIITKPCQSPEEQTDRLQIAGRILTMLPRLLRQKPAGLGLDSREPVFIPARKPALESGR